MKFLSEIKTGSFLSGRSVFFGAGLIALLLGSCKKDNTLPVVDPLPKPGNFFATIDNKKWVSTVSYAEIKDGRLHIYGKAKDGKSLEIDLNDAYPATFSFNETKDNHALYVQDSLNSYDEKVDVKYTGQVVLTKADLNSNKVSGTFKLVLSNTITKNLLSVEEGEFIDIPLISDPFETISFIGQFRQKMGEAGSLNRIDIDALGRVTYTKKANLDYFRTYPANFSIYNSKSDRYLYSDPFESTQVIYKSGLASTEIHQDSVLNAPVRVAGKYYGYKVIAGDVYSIYEMDSLTGKQKTLITTDNSMNSGTNLNLGSSCADANYAYFSIGNQFVRYNPLTNVVKEFNANLEAAADAGFFGIESPSANKLIFCRLAKDTSGVEICMTDLSATNPVQTVLYKMDLSLFYNSEYSSAYNKSKNTYYFVIPDTDLTGTTETTIYFYNLTSGAFGQTKVPGYIFGVETLE